MLTRREFGLVSAGLALGHGVSSLRAFAQEPAADAPALQSNRSRYDTVGVVLYPWDLSLVDWPARAAKAGINTIALHAARRLDVLIAFIQSEAGQRFLADCQALGVQVEYELHAMGELLSRELYYQDTSLFRVDSKGVRNPDFNCCPSNSEALERIAEQAVRIAGVLKPTSHRYFYWPDDGAEWCQCAKCQGLTASDQATLVENAIVTALRLHVDPLAVLSHIAYIHTIDPPRQVQPHAGLFLEFAPINRRYDQSIGAPDVLLDYAGPGPRSHAGYLETLSANLSVFGTDNAQVLEYWLDVSFFSGWTRPSKKLPWHPEIASADAAAYAKLGIRHISTFATWIDACYLAEYGEPPLAEFGRAIRGQKLTQ